MEGRHHPRGQVSCSHHRHVQLATLWCLCCYVLLGCATEAQGGGGDGDGGDGQTPAELFEVGTAQLRGGDSQGVLSGLGVLRRATEAGSAEAAYELGRFFETEHDGRAARSAEDDSAAKYYQLGADLGHAPSQSALAQMYDTGLGGLPKDGAKAMLYHYFASTGGSVSSLMALGYKHMHGIGVPKSCDTAFSYYNPAAEKVIAEAQKPEGMSRFERVRLSEVGEERSGGREDEEIIEYYDYAASKGETRAQLAMGQLNYWGARGLTQNFPQAARWFEKAAAGGDPHAMSMLGHMYASGLAVEQSNETALEWFTKAQELDFAGAANGLGFLHMHGMGVPQDYEKALEYFVSASERGNAEAHFNLGAMYIDGIGVAQDNSKALQHFAVAAGEGHTMALYNLAVMHHNGLGTGRSCELAVQYLKNVVERGSWVRVLQNASQAFFEERYDESLRLYALAAEQGVEMAQSNAAWLADRGLVGTAAAAGGGGGGGAEGGETVASGGGGGSGEGAPSPSPSSSTSALARGLREQERHELALHYYTLSAQQANAGSLLKLADYSYYGLGTDVDYEQSAAYYMQASEMRSAQAYFNLGYMHQFGHGLPKDFHLAKRFYDQTLQASGDDVAAQAPVILAIYGLRLAVWWSTAKDSMPTFVVETVEGMVEALGIGAVPAPKSSGTGEATAGSAGSAGEGGEQATAGAAEEQERGAEASERAEGLWKSWSTFVADTMGVFNQNAEALRLALDPVTLKASLGSSGEVLAAADSDTLTILGLCLVLTFVVYRRWRIQ